MHSGKTIIVTGASSGIGKAIAEKFLEKGANVVINGRNELRLEEFVRNVPSIDPVFIPWQEIFL